MVFYIEINFIFTGTWRMGLEGFGEQVMIEICAPGVFIPRVVGVIHIPSSTTTRPQPPTQKEIQTLLLSFFSISLTVLLTMLQYIYIFKKIFDSVNYNNGTCMNPLIEVR